MYSGHRAETAFPTKFIEIEISEKMGVKSVNYPFIILFLYT